ncbi:SDR family oxidoreductase [Sphingomonas sp. BIUV-7]|uniref:SDR family oxidoreductase n=1 Tax=Sphingomonas natans TaxID=3063330 RepID=A0ABT8YAS2_9SPHN|nr:SDR family oxidoreductase [Sphingomonas sp. BIUV-7]MDO6415415.1 SDR family oxidoreductase [Sphingomonas sp. BIUV-7]
MSTSIENVSQILALEGKVVLVTGGTSGIGLAMVERFASEGARVFAVARGQDRLEALEARLGPTVTGIPADIGHADDLERAFATIAATGLGLDIVFANAGAAIPGVLGSITAVDYRSVFDVTVLGTLMTVQHALPLMRDGGSIVLTGSIAGAKGRAGRSVYNASKAALRSFARSWASDLAPRNIRVNLLSPGPTDTSAFAGASDVVRERMAAQTLRGHLARPSEIAAAALFLASDQASFVNGAELFADDGAAQV